MANLQEFKCPSCGGSIEFDSNIQKMRCPYCDTEFDMAAIRQLEEELVAEGSEEMDWSQNTENQWQDEEGNHMVVYVCKSCGGEIAADRTMVASSCPFCDNQVVMSGNLSGELRPDYVIPFKLDKAAAKEGLYKHFKGKRLLPKLFKDENHIDEVKGVYVPFWLFDADVNGKIHYRGTRVRKWSTRDFDFIETSHFDILRGGSMAFDMVPVDGSTKMPEELMESIEPYNYKDNQEFTSAFLAGFVANKYDISAKESEGRANQRIRASTEHAFRSTVQGYATVTQTSSNLKLSNGQVKYALLPVWRLNTTWRGKQYIFAMNGQTGKFVGDLPLDKGAFVRYFALFTGIISILSFAIMWFIG
jgi:predicted RNA-binding Zn-ribbon protein involved in translation (DUF1610 family)